MYRVHDKSLARTGRKQARKHVRDARDFNNIETRAVIKFFFLQGKAPKEIHAILTETFAYFLPGRAKDLSAPLYIKCHNVFNSYPNNKKKIAYDKRLRQAVLLMYRRADKSLARPGRKQARQYVRDARISTTSRRELSSSFFFLQGKAPKEIHAILTETFACFLPGRAKDLSAPLYIKCHDVFHSYPNNKKIAYDKRLQQAVQYM